MTNATAGMPRDAEVGPESAELINRIAEKLRIDSGSSMPREYFLQQARQQLLANAESPAHTPDPKKDQTYRSSACFDAWAKPDGGHGGDRSNR